MGPPGGGQFLLTWHLWVPHPGPLVTWHADMVANYCQDRIHLALDKEFNVVKEHLKCDNVGNNWHVQLENAFLRCFRKVDMEVAGVHASDRHNANAEEHITEPVASDDVGSTAVVAVICSTHI
ncbi:hypothetical protein AgCh_036454 [Apium graveolens]